MNTMNTMSTMNSKINAIKPSANALSNFTIFDKQGQKKPHVLSGFLSAKWMTVEDFDRGYVRLDDGRAYDLTISRALFKELAERSELIRIVGEEAMDKVEDRVKTICSFQAWADGSLHCFAKVLDRKTDKLKGLIDKLEASKLEAANS